MTWFRISLMQFLAFRRGKKAQVSLIILLLIPLLYGCLYVYAMWDPNSKLNNLPVALVDNDRSATVDGKKVHLGPQIVNTLTKGNNVDWHVVSTEEAVQGMQQDEYYFTLTVPENFSTRIASMSTTNPKQAELVLAANESANYISSQISTQLAGQVAAGMSQTITTDFIDATLTVIEDFRAAIVKATAATRELAADTRKLSAALAAAATASDQLASGAGQVAEANAAIATAAQDAARVGSDASAKSAALVFKLTEYVKAHPTDPIARDLLSAAIRANDVVQSVNSKVQTASTDLDELSNGSSQVAEATEAIAGGVNFLSSRSGELTVGANKLTAALTKAAADIPARTPKQVKQLATVAAQPVGIQTLNVNQVQTNGTAMFAYFVGLALWVGMLIGFSLLSPLPARPLMAARVPTLCAVLVSYLPVAVIGMAQVMVLAFVAKHWVGLDAVYPLHLIGLMVVVSLTYCAMIQMLLGLFGKVGNILALVILAMQMNSSGGTYPLQMYPSFFQDISPYFPMSHIVKAARIAISGGDMSVFMGSLSVVALFGVGSLLLTWLGANKRRKVKVAAYKTAM